MALVLFTFGRGREPCEVGGGRAQLGRERRGGRALVLFTMGRERESVVRLEEEELGWGEIGEEARL
ncbi:hypothetical protein AMTR_s00034p00223490 [Amborella trichopoda]|uniref:Uncharacterized protein n=1 Tax=Amborella trichopoda TaxID=13333 RepID=W1PWJ8_AMBTC|nr:hypothetical protein AMTR_s00034p00223490 [Amborella trichopoda]